MPQLHSVKAKKVRVGDYLAYGDWYGWVVTATAHRSGQVLIYARSGRREDELIADANQNVDIFRD